MPCECRGEGWDGCTASEQRAEQQRLRRLEAEASIREARELSTAFDHDVARGLFVAAQAAQSKFEMTERRPALGRAGVLVADLIMRRRLLDRA